MLSISHTAKILKVEHISTLSYRSGIPNIITSPSDYGWLHEPSSLYAHPEQYSNYFASDQGLYVSVPVRTMPIKDGVKVSKVNPRLSPANRPRSMILASQYWRKPRTPWQKWQSKTAEISRYCSAFPGYGGMRGFPLTRTLRVVFTIHEVAFGVVIRGVELYDLVKIEFWFSLRLRRLRSSENWVVEVESRGGRSKPITRRGNVSYASSSDSDNLVINGVRRKWKPSDSSDSDVVASRLCLRLRSLILIDTVISALITLFGTPRPTQSLVKTSF